MHTILVVGGVLAGQIIVLPRFLAPSAVRVMEMSLKSSPVFPSAQSMNTLGRQVGKNASLRTDRSNSSVITMKSG